MLNAVPHNTGRKSSRRRATGPVIPLPEAPHSIISSWLEREQANDELNRKRGEPPSPYGLSKSSLGRRQLRVQDALLKAIEARGHAVVQPLEHLAPLVAVVHGQRISWDLRERHWRRKVLQPKTEEADGANTFKYALVASGYLSLTIEAAYSSRQDIHEQHRQLFDDRIDEIVGRFEAKAAHIIQKRSSWDEWEQRVQARRAHRERMEILADREEDRWEQLKRGAADWKDAALLRDFVERVAGRMKTLNDRPARAELWLKWARQRVSALDPLQQDARSVYEVVIAKPLPRKSRPSELGLDGLTADPDEDEADFLE